MAKLFRDCRVLLPVYYYDTKKIATYTLVDDDDYIQLRDRTWYLTEDSYVFCRIEGPPHVTMGFIHRLIIQPDQDRQVDHRNRYPLDNSRANLRPASRSENQINRRQPYYQLYKGVTMYGRKHQQGYAARIEDQGQTIELGRYKTREDAAYVFNEAARILHQDWAYLNPLPPLMWHKEQAIRRLARIFVARRRAVPQRVRSEPRAFPTERDRTELKKQPDVLVCGPLFKGVGKKPRGVKVKRWSVHVKWDGRNLFLGSYRSPEAAALVFNEAMKLLYAQPKFINDVGPVTDDHAAKAKTLAIRHLGLYKIFPADAPKASPVIVRPPKGQPPCKPEKPVALVPLPPIPHDSPVSPVVREGPEKTYYGVSEYRTENGATMYRAIMLWRSHNLDLGSYRTPRGAAMVYNEAVKMMHVHSLPMNNLGVVQEEDNQSRTRYQVRVLCWALKNSVRTHTWRSHRRAAG